MADEDTLISDNDVVIAIRDLLSELYPLRERDPRTYIRACCASRRNEILDKYREISNDLLTRGFDTTDLNNTIAIEQAKTDTPIMSLDLTISPDLKISLHRK